MNVEIRPKVRKGNSIAKPVNSIILPPDKSIFHRLLIIGSLTGSKITIPIAAIEEIPVDVYATILALQTLGVPIEISRSEITIQGVGISGYHEPKYQINCANSGTTARLLMGVLAGQQFSSVLRGDQSLSKRPMKRLSDLLNDELDAEIADSANGTLPVSIRGKKLHSGNVILPVASAQMKSSVLLAGLVAQNEVTVAEPQQSRNHTELMLKAFGTGLVIKDKTITIDSGYTFTTPEEFIYQVPGDISSAAFLIGAAILTKRNIVLHNVGINPTRRSFLQILTKSGIEIELSNVKTEHYEERGTLEILAADTSVVKPFAITEEDIPLLIDEIPLLVVLASFCNGVTRIPQLEELRNKETDRLSAIIKNMQSFGAAVSEDKDGIVVFGDPDFQPESASFDHFGDHRIAMAFSVLALKTKEIVTISDASVVSISYPNFFQDLAVIAGHERIRIS